MFKLFKSSLGTVLLPSHRVASPNFRTCLWRGAFQFPASWLTNISVRYQFTMYCQKWVYTRLLHGRGMSQHTLSMIFQSTGFPRVICCMHPVCTSREVPTRRTRMLFQLEKASLIKFLVIPSLFRVESHLMHTGDTLLAQAPHHTHHVVCILIVRLRDHQRSLHTLLWDWGSQKFNELKRVEDEKCSQENFLDTDGYIVATRFLDYKVPSLSLKSATKVAAVQRVLGTT